MKAKHLWLIPAALVLLVACATGLIAKASAEGEVRLWTDGALLVAIGDGSGDFAVSTKGAGFPVTVPFVVKEGFTVVVDLATSEVTKYPEGAELPAAVQALLAE